MQPTKSEEEYEAKQRVFYLNLRAQCFYEFSNLASRHEVKIETEDSFEKERICEELKLIKEVGKEGSKLQIIGKDVIKDDLGRSPDDTDTLMMRMYFELNKEVPLDIL
jgi:phage terminase large subunit